VAGVIAICLVLGGAVAGGVYLLTREDASSEEVVPGGGSGAGGGGGPGGSPGGGSTPVRPSPSERGFPSDSKAAMAAEIEGLLREFHLALVDGGYSYAWSLLTSRKRRKELREQGYSGWRDAQATLTPYLHPAGLEARIDGLEEDGIARVSVTGMGWTAPGSACAEWSGLTWVRYEGGAWRYDPGYSTTADRRRRWEDRSGELLGVGC